MQVSLKKAADISRMALATAKDIQLNHTVNLNVYDDKTNTEIEALVSFTSAKFSTDLNTSVALIAAAYTIRDLISTANASAGISSLMTRRSALDVMEKAYVVANKCYDSSDDVSITSIRNRIEAARTRLAQPSRYGVSDDTIHINGITPDQSTKIVDQIAEIKLKKIEISDELARLNMITTITIDDDTVSLLRNNKIIK